MYTYRARCLRVVDGDTCDLEIDLGLHLIARHRIRILGINTPELHAEDPAVRAKAVLAKDTLTALLPPTPGEWPLAIRTEKDDVFGRWLATIQLGEVDVSTHMLSLGLAVPFKR